MAGTLVWTEYLDARLFRDAGVDPQQPVICTCGSGVTAYALALGLAHIGSSRVSVYDGSWAEWATHHP